MGRRSNKKRPIKEIYNVVYGPHAIIELLRAKKRKLISLYATKPLLRPWDRIKQYLPQNFHNIQFVNKEVLARMAGSPDNNGIVALVTPFKFAKKVFDPSKKPFIILLDGIQDVRNLGAILRTVTCMGADGVVLCGKGGVDLSPTVFKTSAGLAEYLDVYRASSLKSAVSEIKVAGYNLYLAVLRGGKNATKVSYKKPLCLVIGSEGAGISSDILKEGELITIPQIKPDISYNASVAAAILMFIVIYGKT